MGGKITGVSVIVCCYNSSLRLPETLTYLAAQKVKLGTHWELIIVNNNSNDDTVEIAEVKWNQLGAPTTLTIVDEPTAGLSYAREKGISVSQYDLFLFCDDDNWLKSDYIKNVINLFNDNPNIGALGGWSEAVFEDEKPDWFNTFSGNFAVGKPQKESGIVSTAQGFLYGSGMVIHKDTFDLLKKKSFESILTDRKGKLLSSGGDVELIYAIKLLDVPVMFSDLLFFYHFMPKERMAWGYLLKLRQSMYWSNFVLNIYIDTMTNKPLSVIWLLKKILKSIRYIYTQSKHLAAINTHEKLFLENQIAVRRLFLKHIGFYYKTRTSLNQLKDG